VPPTAVLSILIVSSANPRDAAQNGQTEPEVDWDPSAAMDEEAAQEAEIQRRRRAREAAMKRAAANGALVPSIQALQGTETYSSTPGSTRQTTPAPQKTDVNTPNSSKNYLLLISTLVDQ